MGDSKISNIKYSFTKNIDNNNYTLKITSDDKLIFEIDYKYYDFKKDDVGELFEEYKKLKIIEKYALVENDDLTKVVLKNEVILALDDKDLKTLATEFNNSTNKSTFFNDAYDTLIKKYDTLINNYYKDKDKLLPLPISKGENANKNILENLNNQFIINQFIDLLIKFKNDNPPINFINIVLNSKDNEEIPLNESKGMILNKDSKSYHYNLKSVNDNLIKSIDNLIKSINKTLQKNNDVIMMLQQLFIIEIKYIINIYRKLTSPIKEDGKINTNLFKDSADIFNNLNMLGGGYKKNNIMHFLKYNKYKNKYLNLKKNMYKSKIFRGGDVMDFNKIDPENINNDINDYIFKKSNIEGITYDPIKIDKKYKEWQKKLVSLYGYKAIINDIVKKYDSDLYKNEIAISQLNFTYSIVFLHLKLFINELEKEDINYDAMAKEFLINVNNIANKLNESFDNAYKDTKK